MHRIYLYTITIPICPLYLQPLDWNAVNPTTDLQQDKILVLVPQTQHSYPYINRKTRNIHIQLSRQHISSDYRFNFFYPIFKNYLYIIHPPMQNKSVWAARNPSNHSMESFICLVYFRVFFFDEYFRVKI